MKEVNPQRGISEIRTGRIRQWMAHIPEIPIPIRSQSNDSVWLFSGRGIEKLLKVCTNIHTLTPHCQMFNAIREPDRKRSLPGVSMNRGPSHSPLFPLPPFPPPLKSYQISPWPHHPGAPSAVQAEACGVRPCRHPSESHQSHGGGGVR